ncbi:MAG: FMN-binding protein [Solirubrobacterales bacterium]|nr:FMN-binding protein [Solirubrobacterales bacterium]
MNRSVPLVAMTAAGLIPSAGFPLLAVAHPGAGGPSATAATAGRLVTGATYHMRWGDVTVRIRLNKAGKRIVNVGAVLPTEKERSAEINNRAAPILRSEVLRAQSSRINSVSGATLTSEAYVLSLRSAIGKAHL